MKKNILIYGLIGGVIVSTLMLISVNGLSHRVDYNTSLFIGYASMIIGLSLVFVGIRNYRDKYNGGVISFGTAFKIGILIVLIASTMYAIAWVIDSSFFMTNYMEKYAADTLDRLKASGASKAEIDKQAKDMANIISMSKNPLFNLMTAYLEIIPVGLIVTLISSLILKRKVPQTQTI